MDDFQKIIDNYIDNVLRACFHYLGRIPDAETACEEVFVIASQNGLLVNSSDILPELLYITRKVCLADTIKEDNEERFLMNYFHLSRKETEFVMGQSSSHKFANKKHPRTNIVLRRPALVR